MAEKSLENIQKGDLVVYKFPKNRTKKSYGVYMDVEFTSKGDVAIVKDMLEAPKKIIKVPMKDITSAMENFLEAKSDPNSKALKEIMKIGSATSRAGVVPFINLETVKSPTGDEMLAFKWSNEIFDETFTKDDCVDLAGFVRETPTAIEIVTTSPISHIYTITKKEGQEEFDIASLRQVFAGFERTTMDIFNAVKGKFMEYQAKWKTYQDDCQDYVDAYTTRAFIDINEDVQNAINNEKYRLTDESKTVGGIKLYRIEALKDLPDLNIKQGQKGGFIENETNLSLDKDSWVADNAMVYNKARVVKGGIVKSSAKVHDSATIAAGTVVQDNAEVKGRAFLYNAKLSGDVIISDSVQVPQQASLVMSGKATLGGNTIIDSSLIITDGVKIFGTPSGLRFRCRDNATISDSVNISASGVIEGPVSISGKTTINGIISIKGTKELVIRDLNINGTFKFNDAAIDADILKGELTPDSFSGKSDLVGTINIATPEDLLKQITESQDKSPINGAENLKKFVVKNAKFWNGPLCRANVLTDEQKKYLDSLPHRMIDADMDPVDVQQDNTWAKEEGEDQVPEAIYEVAGMYFYGYLGDEDTLQYIIKFDKNLF